MADLKSVIGLLYSAPGDRTGTLAARMRASERFPGRLVTALAAVMK
jgi:hypothetical protein